MITFSFAVILGCMVGLQDGTGLADINCACLINIKVGRDRGAGDREKRGREVYGRREKRGREAGFPK